MEHAFLYSPLICAVHHLICTVQFRGHAGMEQVFTLHMVGWWSIVQNFENVTLSVVMLNIFYLDLCRTL